MRTLTTTTRLRALTTAGLVNNGASAGRFDIVFVADGCTASQMNRFRAAVKAKWADRTAVESFKGYAPLSDVWGVEAVSRQSGTSGGPAAHVRKDTAVASCSGCEDTEHLPCTGTCTV
ncbi:M64 family metallopeptidase [Streptomyces sp. NPDC020801]|uniref:M64 family metallopeptidase n=1 Tax=unclassified Streptomyces TaxID=2593676 RepID=UPI00379EE4CF